MSRDFDESSSDPMKAKKNFMVTVVFLEFHTKGENQDYKLSHSGSSIDRWYIYHERVQGNKILEVQLWNMRENNIIKKKCVALLKKYHSLYMAFYKIRDVPKLYKLIGVCKFFEILIVRNHIFILGISNLNLVLVVIFIKIGSKLKLKRD